MDDASIPPPSRFQGGQGRREFIVSFVAVDAQLLYAAPSHSGVHHWRRLTVVWREGFVCRSSSTFVRLSREMTGKSSSRPSRTRLACPAGCLSGAKRPDCGAPVRAHHERREEEAAGWPSADT
jgi:hypothetical protein